MSASEKQPQPSAIVTGGAGGGIGIGVTRVLAKAGWRVLVVEIDRDAVAVMEAGEMNPVLSGDLTPVRPIRQVRLGSELALSVLW